MISYILMVFFLIVLLESLLNYHCSYKNTLENLNNCLLKVRDEIIKHLSLILCESQ